jgi:hypothetical protein
MRAVFLSVLYHACQGGAGKEKMRIFAPEGREIEEKRGKMRVFRGFWHENGEVGWERKVM